METSFLPLRSPRPDASQAIASLLGHATLARPTLVEYIIDESVMRPVLARAGCEWVDPSLGETAHEAYLKNFAEFYYRMGYSLVKFERALNFPSHHLVAADTAPYVQRDRSWNDQHQGVITSWETFEKYRWPKIEDFDFSSFEILTRVLPEGMGLMLSHAGGPYEVLSALMSYEGLCLALYDDFTLVKAVADRVGELMLRYYQHLLTFDRVVAIFPGDDMGFRTATLIGPDHLRSLTLPWHRRYAELAHARGVPYFLHSCGNLLGIMDTLIDEVGIDGKHSYEDAIIPVEEFQARFGQRIAVLGGLDVHTLSIGTPEDVRRRTRQLIDTCAPRGRYAIGSGNSIPSYIPAENYLAMVEEALR
jgi:uroporphyrinogen decarboxylase